MGKPLYRRGDLCFVGTVILLDRPKVGGTIIHQNKVYRILSVDESSFLIKLVQKPKIFLDFRVN
jgi:hypothetical protein